MSEIIYAQGTATVSLAANDGIAVYTRGEAQVYSVVGYPNYPESESLLGTVINGQTVFAASSSARTIRIEAGSGDVLYNVGTNPVVTEQYAARLQGAPGVLNATGDLTAAMILSGIVTSTTAAAVTADLSTGALLDAAVSIGIGESFDWSAINTGGANAFTVTANTGHTVVGAGAVAASTSGLFRTRKTAADTFVTYRIG
jgi:hypothetical protein